MERRLEAFVASKPYRWRRRLVQRPWLLPVIAMHLAARRVQRAWRASWLRLTRAVAVREAPQAPPPTPASPRRRAQATLRRRHLEHLRRRMIIPREREAPGHGSRHV